VAAHTAGNTADIVADTVDGMVVDTVVDTAAEVAVDTAAETVEHDNTAHYAVRQQVPEQLMQQPLYYLIVLGLEFIILLTIFLAKSIGKSCII